MRRLGYALLLCLATCGVMTLVVLVGEGIDAYYRSRLVDMVHGTAYRPYVHRVLVPGLARLGTAVLPGGIKQALTSAFAAWTWRPDGWLPAYATEYVLVLLVMAVSLIGFTVALRGLFRTLFAASDAAGSAAALVSLACVPMFFGPFSRQIYDFTTLWLFTLGLALMARFEWIKFAMLFILACLNKETSILLTLVFLVHFSRDFTLDVTHVGNRLSPVGFRRLLAYQLIVFLVIRASVAYLFRNNPGSPVELHLFDHNQLVLMNPRLMSKRLPLLATAALAGAWRWQEKPPFLRRAFLVLVPALLIVGVSIGQIDEIRAYYELYPVVVLMVAHSVCRALGVSIRTAPSGPSAPRSYTRIAEGAIA